MKRMPRPVVFRVARTSTFVWLVARAGMALLGVLVLGPLGRALFIGLVLWLTWFDIRATSERVLYADLGISPLGISLITILVAGSLEAAVAVSLQVFLPDLASGMLP